MMILIGPVESDYMISVKEAKMAVLRHYSMRYDVTISVYTTIQKFGVT